MGALYVAPSHGKRGGCREMGGIAEGRRAKYQLTRPGGKQLAAGGRRWSKFAAHWRVFSARSGDEQRGRRNQVSRRGDGRRLVAQGWSKPSAREPSGNSAIAANAAARAIDGEARWPIVFGGLWLDVRHAIRALRRSPPSRSRRSSSSSGIRRHGGDFLRRGRRAAPRPAIARAGGWWRSANGRDIQRSKRPSRVNRMAPQDYADVASGQKSFRAIGALASGSITLQSPGGEPEDIAYQRVTAGFFDALDIRPVLGRAMVESDESDGHQRVALISAALSQRRFGGINPLGQTLSLGGDRFEIIGVLPAGFSYPPAAPRPADVWVPYVVSASERTRVLGKLSMYLQVVARLETGVRADEAQAKMQRIAAAAEAANHVWNKEVKFGVRRLRDHVVGATTSMGMLMLLGSVGLVLAVACANVAALHVACDVSITRNRGSAGTRFGSLADRPPARGGISSSR